MAASHAIQNYKHTKAHTHLVPHPTEESTHVHKQLHCCATVLPDVFARTKSSQHSTSSRLITGSTLASALAASTRKKGALANRSNSQVLLCQKRPAPPAPMHHSSAMHGMLHHRHVLRPRHRLPTTDLPRTNCIMCAGMCSLGVHARVRQCDHGIACCGSFDQSSNPDRHSNNHAVPMLLLHAYKCLLYPNS